MRPVYTAEVDWRVSGQGDHIWYAQVDLIANETSTADNTLTALYRTGRPTRG